MNPYNDCNLKIINGTPDAAFDYFLQKTIPKLLIEKQVAAVLKLQTRIDETESSNRISWRHLMSLASFFCLFQNSFRCTFVTKMRKIT